MRVACVLLSVVLATCALTATAKKPWFCHDLDCPEYTVGGSNEDYEVRTYAKGKYASTKVEGYLYSASLLQGFKVPVGVRLFDYISGENEGSHKINMTAPVVTKVEHGEGPFCKSNFTVSFFVPFGDQDDTPKPTNPDVYIHGTASATFFVSQYAGFGQDDITVSLKANALADKLTKAGENFVAGLFFTAGYDPPFRLTGRHNEIWIVKQSGAAAVTSA